MNPLEKYMQALANRPKPHIIIDWGEPVEIEPTENEADLDVGEWG